MQGKKKMIKYIHPSACQYEANQMYLLSDIQKEIKSESVIREMFEPINFEWDNVDVKGTEKADINQLKSKFNRK